MAEAQLGWAGAAILTTTLLALLYATYAPELTAKLKGSFDMGMVLMMIFFASLGAQADLVGTLDSAPAFFGFVIIIVAVHAVILFTAGKFLKLTLPELITASNACILGPATAAGLAGTKGWKSLVTPGILQEGKGQTRAIPFGCAPERNGSRLSLALLVRLAAAHRDEEPAVGQLEVGQVERHKLGTS